MHGSSVHSPDPVLNLSNYIYHIVSNIVIFHPNKYPQFDWPKVLHRAMRNAIPEGPRIKLFALAQSGFYRNDTEIENPFYLPKVNTVYAPLSREYVNQLELKRDIDRLAVLDFVRQPRVTVTALSEFLNYFKDKIDIQQERGPGEFQLFIDQAHYELSAAEAAFKFGVGNCGENASCVAMLLYQLPDFPHMHGMRVENVILSDGDHSFVILNRQPGSRLEDPATWGDSAVICDAWGKASFLVGEQLALFGTEHCIEIFRHINTCLRDHLAPAIKALGCTSYEQAQALYQDSYTDWEAVKAAHPQLAHLKTFTNLDSDNSRFEKFCWLNPFNLATIEFQCGVGMGVGQQPPTMPGQLVQRTYPQLWQLPKVRKISEQLLSNRPKP